MPNKIEVIIVSVIIAGLSITLLILSCLIFDHLKFKTKNIEKYNSNWKLNPVMSLTKGINGKCEENSTPLITSQYPGIFRGCNCKNSSKKEFKKEGVYLNFCSENQLNNGCTDIKEQNTIDVNYWKNTLLCAQKDTKYTFNEIMNKGYFKECPPVTTKKCGFIDTQDNLFCARNGEECPINYIEIVASNKEPSFKEDLHEIALDNEYRLVYSNKKTDGNILVQAVVNENENVCSFPNEGLIGENDYILNKNKGNEKCSNRIEGKEIDQRYIKLDTQSLNNVLMENKISDLIKDLPDYPYIENKVASLHYINYLGIKQECYGSKYNSLFKPDYEIIVNTSYGLLFFMIFDFIFIFCCFSVYRIYSFGNWKNCRLFTVDIVHFIFEMIILGFSAAIYAHLKGALREYDDFMENKCGDKFMMKNLEIGFRDLSNSKKYAKATVILCIIEILIKTGYAVYFYFNMKKKKLE